MSAPKTAVVTGAAGYIGGQTMLALKDAGHRVIGIDREPVPQHLEGVADYSSRQTLPASRDWQFWWRKDPVQWCTVQEPAWWVPVWMILPHTIKTTL